ncbi:MAG: class I SAM-dependent methyltransferase, partial [bacterium]
MNSAKDDPLYRHGKHYDQQHGYLTDDIDFYLEQAKKFGQPILELACGTGRITIPIAKQGAEIVGLDISEQMLARAKEKVHNRQLKIRWIHDDVRSFDLKQKFKLIIFTFNSIAHLHDHESIRACLVSVRNHLHEEGRFIVHFFNP